MVLLRKIGCNVTVGVGQINYKYSTIYTENLTPERMFLVYWKKAQHICELHPTVIACCCYHIISIPSTYLNKFGQVVKLLRQALSNLYSNVA